MVTIRMRQKRLVFIALFMMFALGLALTLGEVPLAVSQPVTIPVKAVQSGTSIPMDAAHPLWESTPGVVVPLSGQTITTPMHPNISVKSVMVRAMTNGEEIAIWMNWADQTKNDTTIGPQDFRDQAAVQFPVSTSGAPPFQCMGQSGGTVNIWRWNAEWQKDLGKSISGMWSVSDQYPSMASDGYMQEPAGGVTFPDRTGLLEGPFNEGAWSGNIMADPKLRVSPVEDLNANGFSTLTTQVEQSVHGNGLWEPYGSLKGGCCIGPSWRVVMKRALNNGDSADVQFKAGASIPAAFAVWDGTNLERNGMKGISTWYMFQMP